MTPEEPDDLGIILLGVLVIAAALMLVLSGCGAKPVTPEHEPAESAFTPACADKLKVGMTTATVEDTCGPPTSTLYVPDFPDVTAFRFCRTTECHQMYTVAFLDGHSQFWGRAYEVMR